MKRVDTHSAGEFICDQCGRNGYFRWVRLDCSKYSESEIADLKEVFEIEGDIANCDIWTEPDVITCSYCGSKFEVCNLKEEHQAHSKHNHKLPTVETFYAGEFECPDCDKTSMFSLITVDESVMDQDELAAVKAKSGMDIDENSEIVLLPHKLTCGHCGSEFTPTDDTDEDGESEDTIDC